jgi:hypothetical protein
MKKFNFALLMIAVTFSAIAQKTEAVRTMEKRANEFHRMITVNDRNAWIKFMQENFTKKLQEKPFKKNVQKKDQETDVLISKSEKDEAATLEGKTALFDQLYRDFGTAKIKSLKTENNKSEMILDNNGVMATLTIKYAEQAPYLIDGLGIEIRSN